MCLCVSVHTVNIQGSFVLSCSNLTCVFTIEQNHFPLENESRLSLRCPHASDIRSWFTQSNLSNCSPQSYLAVTPKKWTQAPCSGLLRMLELPGEKLICLCLLYLKGEGLPHMAVLRRALTHSLHASLLSILTLPTPPHLPSPQEKFLQSYWLI
jgi:hypothetical protein